MSEIKSLLAENCEIKLKFAIIIIRAGRKMLSGPVFPLGIINASSLL